MTQQDLQEQGHDQNRLRAGFSLSGPWTGNRAGSLFGLVGGADHGQRADQEGPHRGCDQTRWEAIWLVSVSNEIHRSCSQPQCFWGSRSVLKNVLELRH